MANCSCAVCARDLVEQDRRPPLAIQAFEPLSEIHNRAKNRNLHLIVAADFSCYGAAAGDADPRLEIGQRMIGLLGRLLKGPLNGERRRHRTQRAIFFATGQPQNAIAASP